MDRLPVDGWEVAQVELDRSWSGRELPDTCWLFRSPAAWTLVTLSRQVRYGDGGEPVAGHATVAATVFAALEELADHVEHTYTGGGWVELLDDGWQHDAELHRAWVPERIRRDFDDASIHVKSLALYTGLVGGGPAVAPARDLSEEGPHAVALMGERLAVLGFEVLEGEPTVTDDDNDFGDPVLGALRVRRYGWEAVGVVRVDAVGEVFVRLPDPEGVDGPVLRPLTEEDDS